MSTLYYCSEECAREDLPVECEVRRLLALEGMPNKAAVVRTKTPIYRSQLSDFVALAKGTATIDAALQGELVGVYLLPLDARAGDRDLDLTKGLQPVQDWGALTIYREAAEQWQLRA
jgi:hypothetical protein